MQAPDQDEPPPPVPIEGGRVPQVVVEYIGTLEGAMTFTPPSGRRYQFGLNRWHRRQYVYKEDEGYFRRKVIFRVLPDREIDPAKVQLERLVDKRVDDRIAELHPARSVRRPGGRPPVPTKELQRLWHLRNHCLPPWSIDLLAAEFLKGEFATPRAAISARLYRFKRDYPELTAEDRCPWCAGGYAPNAPARP